MASITVSIDEETLRLSNIKAVELGTSVPALVRGYLERLVGDGFGGTVAGGPGAEEDVELRLRDLDEVLADFDARGVGLRSSDNLTREELYNEAINGPNALR